jgi:Topoisomerase DNA binding C4 zinc finger
MSSRRNDSAGVAIVELTALLPWWGGVMLAGASYGALHLYVSRPMSPVSLGDSTFLIQAMTRALATTGQYLLPVLFLIAALTSVFRRRKRRQLLAGVSAAPDALNAMSWREFEMLVGEAFRGRNLTLIDGPQLHAMIQGVSQNSLAAKNAVGPIVPAESPACPTCSKPMAMRTARRGPKTGQRFWGCTGYPTCRGTRDIGSDVDRQSLVRR